LRLTLKRFCGYLIRMALEDTLQTRVAQAVRKAGGQAALGRILGVPQSTVSTWLRRGNELPAKHVRAVEAALGIPRHELRPDLFDPPAQHPAAHPSASAPPAPQAPGAGVDGSSPAPDSPSANPLEGLAA
jgi:DNA-binding transcriptional regulator YdaS (Cro superfamily)